MIWTIEKLFNDEAPKQSRNGMWTAARPMNYKFRTWRQLFKELYLIITKKGDVVTWDTKINKSNVGFELKEN